MATAPQASRPAREEPMKRIRLFRPRLAPRPSLKERAKAIGAVTAKILHLPMRKRETAFDTDGTRRALVAGSFAAAGGAVVAFPAFGDGEGGGTSDAQA